MKPLIRKRYFRTHLNTKISQWWLYKLNNSGCLEPIVGTTEKKLKDAKLILLRDE